MKKIEKIIKDHLIGTQIADRYIVTGWIGGGGMSGVAEVHVNPRIAKAQQSTSERRAKFMEESAKSESYTQRYARQSPEEQQEEYDKVFPNLPADQRRLKDRRRALKIMDPDLLDLDDNTLRLAERFDRETRMMMSIDHPNVVKIIEHGKTEIEVKGDKIPINYIAMEYVNNQAKVLPLTRHEAVRVALETAKGLKAIHAKGLIHRDIKPDNILIDENGQVKITDFGLSKAYKGSSSLAKDLTGGGFVGTPAYSDPERARGGKHVGPISDVYSLGATLYELVTGEDSVNRMNNRGEELTEMEIIGQIANPAEHVEWPSVHDHGMSEDLENVIMQMLSKTETGADNELTFERRLEIDEVIDRLEHISSNGLYERLERSPAVVDELKNQIKILNGQLVGRNRKTDPVERAEIFKRLAYLHAGDEQGIVPRIEALQSAREEFEKADIAEEVRSAKIELLDKDLDLEFRRLNYLNKNREKESRIRLNNVVREHPAEKRNRRLLAGSLSAAVLGGALGLGLLVNNMIQTSNMKSSLSADIAQAVSAIDSGNYNLARQEFSEADSWASQLELAESHDLSRKLKDAKVKLVKTENKDFASRHFDTAKGKLESKLYDDARVEHKSALEFADKLAQFDEFKEFRSSVDSFGRVIDTTQNHDDSVFHFESAQNALEQNVYDVARDELKTAVSLADKLEGFDDFKGQLKNYAVLIDNTEHYNVAEREYSAVSGFIGGRDWKKASDAIASIKAHLSAIKPHDDVFANSVKDLLAKVDEDDKRIAKYKTDIVIFDGLVKEYESITADYVKMQSLLKDDKFFQDSDLDSLVHRLEKVSAKMLVVDADAIGSGYDKKRDEINSARSSLPSLKNERSKQLFDYFSRQSKSIESVLDGMTDYTLADVPAKVKSVAGSLQSVVELYGLAPENDDFNVVKTQFEVHKARLTNLDALLTQYNSLLVKAKSGTDEEKRSANVQLVHTYIGFGKLSNAVSHLDVISDKSGLEAYVAIIDFEKKLADKGDYIQITPLGLRQTVIDSYTASVVAYKMDVSKADGLKSQLQSLSNATKFPTSQIEESLVAVKGLYDSITDLEAQLSSDSENQELKDKLAAERKVLEVQQGELFNTLDAYSANAVALLKSDGKLVPRPEYVEALKNAYSAVGYSSLADAVLARFK